MDPAGRIISSSELYQVITAATYKLKPLLSLLDLYTPSQLAERLLRSILMLVTGTAEQICEDEIHFHHAQTFDKGVSPVYLYLTGSTVVAEKFTVNTNHLQ